jgi:hypothetical protein
VVATEQVDAVLNERGEPLDVGVADGVAAGPEWMRAASRRRGSGCSTALSTGEATWLQAMPSAIIPRQ